MMRAPRPGRWALGVLVGLLVACGGSARHASRMSKAPAAAAFTARIVSRRPMLYRAGADPALDRPAHVRAASGLAWLGDRLAVVQDDAHFVALVEPESGLAEAVPLPADAAGRRVFDEARGTKRLKLDLESCLVRRDARGLVLLAFGSGSLPRRERIVVMRWDEARNAPEGLRVVDASALYAMLRAHRELSGSELNLEGAVEHAGALLVFQRGNGAPTATQPAVNAVGVLAFDALERYLEGGPVPALQRSVAYDLGSVAGVPYTFTDATRTPAGEILFLASAEASSDSVNDGALYGSVVGELLADDQVRTTPLEDERGQPSADKAEGIVLDPRDPTRAWVVVDADAPETPGMLLEVRLTGRSAP